MYSINSNRMPYSEIWSELLNLIPEIDIMLGVNDYNKISSIEEFYKKY